LSNLSKGGMEAPPNVYADIILIKIQNKDTSSSPIQRSPIRSTFQTNSLINRNFPSESNENLKLSVEYLLCKTLDTLDLQELEQLENIYISNLPKILKAKKDKIEQMYKVDRIVQLEQENMKLRQQFKEIIGNGQPMDIIGMVDDQKSITFGSVSTRTYNIEQVR
jgi:predicted transcriptional regulator